jgi:hypothetical protein
LRIYQFIDIESTNFIYKIILHKNKKKCIVIYVTFILTKEKFMEQVTFNTEITVEDKYREFDLGIKVFANIKEESQSGYPTELIVDLEEVEVDDQRDITPYENGLSLLARLDNDTIEYLKDEAVRRS